MNLIAVVGLTKGFFKRLANLFRLIVPVITKYVIPAIEAAEVIKQALENPKIKAFVDNTPATWDDKLYNQIIKHLSNTVKAYKLVDDCLKPNLTELERVQCLITELQKYPKHVQDALIAKLAAQTVRGLTNKKISNTEADLLIQSYYTTKYKQIKTA